jgi:hypothetical protein
LGWSAAVPSIQRKTDKQLPRYADADESDVFMISGAEDLVPALKTDGTPDEFTAGNFRIKRYRPRMEGSFTRIERVWPVGENTFYWKVTAPGNAVTFFGSSQSSRVADPENPAHIFRWLPEIASMTKEIFRTMPIKPRQVMLQQRTFLTKTATIQREMPCLRTVT